MKAITESATGLAAGFACDPENFRQALRKALNNLADGRMVIVTTTAQDFATGHLVMSARHVSAEAVNFMAKQGKGLVSLALCADDVDRLGLQPMKQRGRSGFRQDPLISIEARTGVSTGISAADRAHTIQTAIDPRNEPAAIVSPGHVFPVRIHPGGILSLPAPAEASADLCRMIGLPSSAVLCAVLGPDGNVADLAYLAALASAHDLAMISVEQLSAHLRAQAPEDRSEGSYAARSTFSVVA